MEGGRVWLAAWRICLPVQCAPLARARENDVAMTHT
jgi:hypothetical protein